MVALNEMRGVWLQAARLGDADDVTDYLDKFEAAQLTDVFYNIHEGGARYNSAYYNRANPNFDALGTLITAAHARSMRVHAWVYPGYDIFPFNSTWDIYNDGGGLPHHTKFSVAAARQRCADVASDVLSKYSVDGYHMDYIRYPDTQTYDLSDYSYTDVTACVQAVKAVMGGVPLTTAVKRQDGLERFLQDWHTWLTSGYIDYAIPMVYAHSPAGSWLPLDMYYDFADWPEGYEDQIIVGLSDLYTNVEGEPAKDPQQIVAELWICKHGGFRGFVVFDDRATEALFKTYTRTPSGPNIGVAGVSAVSAHISDTAYDIRLGVDSAGLTYVRNKNQASITVPDVTVYVSGTSVKITHD